MSHKPPIGEPNHAALIAAIIGSIGGLFALGIAPSILSHYPRWLARFPKLNVISFFLCGVAGWYLGGQLGPRLEALLGQQKGHIAGGITSGLLPVAGVAGLGWYLVTH